MSESPPAGGEQTLHAIDKRLTVHEKVCAERQTTILQRLGRIETVLMAATGFLLASQLDIVKTLLGAFLRHP